MSNNAERCTPPADAWPLEDRKQMMRDVVRLIASTCALKLENAPAIAGTYGPDIKVCEVEAEMLKHMTEGDAK